MGYSKGMVSFCCLSYNHAEYISKCLESIWAQDYKNIEIIILDDGSTDNSLKVIRECEKKSPCKFTVLSQKNSGGKVGANFNRLIASSRGEYLFFISTDDEILQSAISSKIQYLLGDEKLVFVANSRINQINENSQIDICNKKYSWETKYDISDINQLIEAEFENVGTFFIQGALFRRQIVNDISGFDDDLLGDDIILRTKLFFHIQKNSHLKYKILKESAVNYRVHDTNAHKNTYRHCKLIYEWYIRYFSDRKPSKKILELCFSAYFYSLEKFISSSEHSAKELSEELSIYKEYLSKYPEEERRIVFDKYMNIGSMRIKEYSVIPRILMLVAKKSILTNKIHIYIKIFGLEIKILSFNHK